MILEFKEEQKFSQWWIWLILLLVGIVPIYGIYKQLIMKEQFGDKPMSDIGLVIFALVTVGVIALFYYIRLKTDINKYEISFSFSPFTKKKIKWMDVKTAKVINYGFIGGYGIRLGTKYGTVYNISGKKGLFIELKSGKKLLIGTQRPNELSKITDRILELQANKDFRELSYQ